QLRASRSRLHMGEIEDAHAVERLARRAPWLAARLRQSIAVLRRRLLGGGLLRRAQFHDFLFRGRLLGGSPLHLRLFCFALRHFRFLNFRFWNCVGWFYFLPSLLCGLRLPILPLSLPAPGSSTALMRVGLPEFMAELTVRFNSSGEVALTPTPPKASIILS